MSEEQKQLILSNIIVAVFVGLLTWAFVEDITITNFLKLEKPYCESRRIHGKKYTRCWKAVEVDP